jgi:hypothetical protein
LVIVPPPVVHHDNPDIFMSRDGRAVDLRKRVGCLRFVCSASRLFRLSGANRSGDLIEYVARELDWLRETLINAAPRGQDPLQLDG